MGLSHIIAVFFISLVISGISSASIRGRQVYEFPEGEDATVFFHHDNASSEATYSYDLFAPDQDCVFCVDGIMDTSCLSPGQRHRVLVQLIRNKTLVMVSMLLQEIVRSDRGFFILALRETIDDCVTNLIQVAYIDVTFPPGEAQCELRSSLYGPKWKELHCTATVGNDGKGNLTCFQNLTECVFLSPVTYSSTHITATFWVDQEYPVQCCSFPTYDSVTQQSCRQFTHFPVARD